MSEFLDNIKVGDEVLLSGGGYYRSTKRVLAVDRTTKTQIVIGNTRYGKRSGYPVGSNNNRWSNPQYIGPVTDRDRLDIKRDSALCILKDIKWGDFDDDSLFEIAEFVHTKRNPDLDRQVAG